MGSEMMNATHWSKNVYSDKSPWFIIPKMTPRMPPITKPAKAPATVVMMKNRIQDFKKFIFSDIVINSFLQ